ncbi:MAG TPA: phosphopantetheine-binding protein [Myxococcota bacterium]
MTKEKIYTMFVEVLAEHFEIQGDQVHSRARLVADLDLDSLDLIALGAEIEDKSGIALEEKDIRDCETIGELIDRFAARLAERAI